MADVKLYHWESNANSGKPIIGLIEKGVVFESCYTDFLSFDQHKPEYLAINPNGTIPVLVHGDVMLAFEQFEDNFLRLTRNGQVPVPKRRAGWVQAPAMVDLHTSATPNGWKISAGTIEEGSQ
ncbi:MAG: glutathione S-transferase N-terminal domain-containing protein [Gammaproteobacteria bacterium]|nr:glutathione S-transferase N-terminal domain-containing protein [Gammaproteobacteria bacterium]MDH5346188.1 glutathione S-transferase N-terminal domain-containing protein [Gammaproteobacteria bacterium]